MTFLDELKIPYQKLIVPDAPHSAMAIYQQQGLRIMKFHEGNFRAVVKRAANR
jgi:endo-1,4-beta-xylanase